MSTQTGTMERPVTAPLDAPAAAPVTRRKLPVVPIVLGVAALIGLGFGVNRLIWERSHVSTDNAEVEGNIVPALARVSGFIAEIPVKENQAVKEGDLLVRLDDREQKAKLAQATADLAAAEAAAGEKGRPGQMEAQLATAKAQVSQAEANATRARADVDRYGSLAARGIVSRQQLDGAKANADAADAALLAMRKQVLAAQAMWQGADARLAAMKAARDQAELTLGYTHIVAPTAGIVSRKTVEPGQYLQSGQTTMAIVPLNDVWVVGNLKETDIQHVRIGDAVEIKVDSYPGRVFHGRVESLSPATGAKFSLLPPDNATGNFTRVVQRIPVRIKVDGPVDANHPLRPGMSADVSITATGNR